MCHVFGGELRIAKVEGGKFRHNIHGSDCVSRRPISKGFRYLRPAISGTGKSWILLPEENELLA